MLHKPDWEIAAKGNMPRKSDQLGSGRCRNKRYAAGLGQSKVQRESANGSMPCEPNDMVAIGRRTVAESDGAEH